MQPLNTNLCHLPRRAGGDRASGGGGAGVIARARLAGATPMPLRVEGDRASGGGATPMPQGQGVTARAGEPDATKGRG